MLLPLSQGESGFVKAPNQSLERTRQSAVAGCLAAQL